jgi:hypothetical protein
MGLRSGERRFHLATLVDHVLRLLGACHLLLARKAENRRDG